MAGTKEIKNRIKSAKNTKKITKAMELVSASKMKRAISATISARPYSEYSWEVLEALSQYISENKNPFFIKRDMQKDSGKTLIITITSNRGLCGGYNAQVVKNTISYLKNNKNSEVDFISVGKKGESMLRRFGQNIIASFNEIPETPSFMQVLPILKLALDLYNKDEYSAVFISGTVFKSAISQIPTNHQILPIEKKEILEDIEDTKKDLLARNTEYIFEPNYQELMDIIVEKIIRNKFYQIILDSCASEQSSRMMAMKNASDASGEMIGDLTLMFNKARQSNITREISEISAGMASIN